MYKICQKEQSLQRQRTLENGLLELMRKHRYEDISVSDLCEYMQIPRKSFYRYFSSKDGALYALLDHTISDFYETPQQSRATRGSAVGDLDLFFLFWYERKNFLDALQRNGLSGLLVERANAFALREGHLPRQFRRWNPESQGLALSFAICGLMSMTLQWHRQGYHISAQEMTKLAIEMLTQPLLHK